MFKPKYLIRMDDACPTMDRSKWSKVEAILDNYYVKPLVAIIPNNQDATLMPDAYDENFWDKARAWQHKGWGIALHGFNHVYSSESSGILSLNKFSEFSGLSYEAQADKITSGLKLLKAQNLQPKIWIAPGHTFDSTTLQVLRDKSDIRIISDGHSYRSWIENEFVWIPQQVATPKAFPFGTWTFCLHPNTMTDDQILELENFLKNNKHNILSYQDVLNGKLYNKPFLNGIIKKLIFAIRKFKKIISR
jgi:predicted deacetylase